MFKAITSRDNDKIKQLRKLQHKKYRDKLDLFCAENLIIIYDALQAGYVPERLFLTETLLGQKNPMLISILESIDSYFLINKQINKSFSSLETPSGICAVYQKKKSVEVKSKNIFYLNAIKDPGNLGTILRTALAFDFNNIVVDEYCADLYNPKTISSAKDSLFKLNIEKDDKFKILNNLRKEYKIIVTDVQSGSDVSRLDKGGKYCVVLGNEVKGVDATILEMAQEKIHIQMKGDIESLNVAASAAIILYELAKGD